MKRFFPVIFAFFFLLKPLFADDMQIVLPKIVYIGDTVEIRYVFHSDARLFSGDFSTKPNARLNLRTDYLLFKASEEDFTIRSAFLEKINSEYTLSLTVVPWKTGYLSIPQFNLNSLVNFSSNFAVGKQVSFVSVPFIVNLSPVEVRSLVKKTGVQSFMPPSSPLTLPGTAALLVIIGIVSLILFSFVIFVLIRIPQIAKFFRRLSYLLSLKKNTRRAIKNISRLMKSSSKIKSDKEFARMLQNLIREFLGKRFSHDFSSVTTGKLYNFFLDLCAGDMDENQERPVEKLFSIFLRLDYIRFSKDAAFLVQGKHKSQNERFTICKDAIGMVRDFDSESQEEENDSL